MSPTEVVGFLLDRIFPPNSTLPPPVCVTSYRSLAVLHECHKYTPKQLIQYLYSINGQIPKSYELLRCHSDIDIDDLNFFFQRIEYFPRHYFLLQVDLLSSKLQEVN